MNTRNVLGGMLAVVLIAALWSEHAVQAANIGPPPTIKPDSYVGNATTSAQSISAIMGTGTRNNAGCRLCNPSTVHICLGGSGVDTTETAGGHCWPICNTSACAEQCTSLTSDSVNLYAKAGGTQAFFMLCGDWK